ncbi:hypothetical protein [Bifidobacterium callitrichos]|uniref:hypothetical protein n=1 Tax=Bifidobacterium callitrichos TaxID=762209 RepID=UPI0011B26989|nr:hypothetical protein [Bifidobacterium callitrichos]
MKSCNDPTVMSDRPAQPHGCAAGREGSAPSGLFNDKEKDMPWWVDVAYVVGTIVIFVLFDLFGKWVDKL